jgi:hypothetical protein
VQELHRSCFGAVPSEKSNFPTGSRLSLTQATTMASPPKNPFHPGDFVNFRPLPPEGGASVVSPYLSMSINEQQMAKICC